MFKSWIALSIGVISIQWISISKTNCTTHWIEIYLVDRAIHLLNNWGQRCLVKYRNPLLSIKPPFPRRDLFISITIGQEGVGLKRPGGIFEMGVLFCLAKTMVSVLPKELEYKVENHKYEKLKVTQPRINKRSKLPVGK